MVSSNTLTTERVIEILRSTPAPAPSGSRATPGGNDLPHALGRLLAHELNNALAPVLMAIPILQRSLREPASVSLLQSMETAAQRGAALVTHLVSLSQQSSGHRTRCDIAALATNLVRSLRASTTQQPELDPDLPHGLWPVIADPLQLEQLLLTACLGARHAIRKGGRLCISLANRTDGLPPIPGACVRFRLVRLPWTRTGPAAASPAAALSPQADAGWGAEWLSGLEAMAASLDARVAPIAPPTGGVGLDIHLPALLPSPEPGAASVARFGQPPGRLSRA
jgi:hypothetical protein